MIPIVQTGALQIETGGRTWSVEALVAERLAQRLRLPSAGAPATLDHVTRQHLARQPRGKAELYLRAAQALKDLDLQAPAPLCDLAAIADFDLFVSVSSDGLMARAVDDTRHQGQPRTEVLAFAPNRVVDLPHPRAMLARPTVFHLLGRLTSAPESVICDDDRLEFLHALQDDARRPKLLFDELRENHLLLLGCTFPDWAARFFLRTAKNERLSAGRATREYLIGARAEQDDSLLSFLADVSPDTWIVDAEPGAFMSELRQRWQSRHPAGRAVPAAPSQARQGPAEGAVFVSYSSRDRACAERIVRGLEGRGIDVWFDRDQLNSGDAWRHQILRGLKTCSLFVPVISATTVLDEFSADFFWQEWNAADRRAGEMRQDRIFIVPVAIDDTPPYTGKLPASFDDRQWTQLPAGEPSEAFLDRMQQLFRAAQRLAERRKAA